MTQQEAELIARLLGQFHDGMAFTVAAFMGDDQRTVADVAREVGTSNPLLGIVSGFIAIAIVYSFDAVAKPLHKRQEFRPLIDLSSFTITVNNQDSRENETDTDACFRHLRNAFAHGHFDIDSNLKYHLFDENINGNRTFEAHADVQVIVDLAGNLLVKAEELTTARAEQPT